MVSISLKVESSARFFIMRCSESRGVWGYQFYKDATCVANFQIL